MKILLTALLVLLSITASARPKTLLSCQSPENLEYALEVFVERLGNNSSATAFLEITGRDRRVVALESPVRITFGREGTTYASPRFNLQVKVLPRGALHGTLTGAKWEIPTYFLCQALR
jgi:hypothetical protein